MKKKTDSSNIAGLLCGAKKCHRSFFIRKTSSDLRILFFVSNQIYFDFFIEELRKGKDCADVFDFSKFQLLDNFFGDMGFLGKFFDRKACALAQKSDLAREVVAGF